MINYERIKTADENKTIKPNKGTLIRSTEDKIITRTSGINVEAKIIKSI